MSAAESKREHEKQVVQLMIRLYCKKLHGTQKGLCPECPGACGILRYEKRQVPLHGDKRLFAPIAACIVTSRK